MKSADAELGSPWTKHARKRAPARTPPQPTPSQPTPPILPPTQPTVLALCSRVAKQRQGQAPPPPFPFPPPFHTRAPTPRPAPRPPPKDGRNRQRDGLVLGETANHGEHWHEHRSASDAGGGGHDHRDEDGERAQHVRLVEREERALPPVRPETAVALVEADGPVAVPRAFLPCSDGGGAVRRGAVRCGTRHGAAGGARRDGATAQGRGRRKGNSKVERPLAAAPRQRAAAQRRLARSARARRTASSARADRRTAHASCSARPLAARARRTSHVVVHSG